MKNTPPFQITPLILSLSQRIMLCLGQLSVRDLVAVPIKLRRINNIKTIQASLAIEGNTLGVEEVTLLMEGKRVIGPAGEIQEVTNAVKVYDNLAGIDPMSEEVMLSTHSKLMQGLVKDSGHWRSGEVGIWQGKALKHMAPPAKRVPELMSNLFQFIKKDQDLTWLIKACIFHYEFEFIHPFSDGNGRMGRLWQQLLLMKQDPIFEFMPVEVMIKQNQQEYYRVLGECDVAGESTLFIEFSLQQILKTLEDYTDTYGIRGDSASRLDLARSRLNEQWFSRQQYMEIHPSLSSATASRDLSAGLENGLLQTQGAHNQTRYRFVKEI